MRSLPTAMALAASFSLALADITKCGVNNPCPASSPCCSQYGQCGVGAYCLGGCDPRYSHTLDSCMAAPVCQSSDYKLTSLDGITPNTRYLGDASQANWVSSGTPVVYNDQSVLLTMAPNTVGTLLTSTHYVWYGKISATMSTSQGAGVVTAFIMMSDVQDEIDFEFVGVDLEHAQSNYYWQGVLDYQNGANLSVSDTRQNMHTYEFDWNPDQITWSIDGQTLRTVKKSDTWNSTSNSYKFPQTPARIQLSLWPAGLQSNGQGTVDWAGGLVDWDSPYMQNGYYYAIVNDVNVECYNPPSGYNNQGNKAYYYNSVVGTNNTVVVGNNNTILSSFLATGDNPSYNPDAASSSKGSSPSSTATASATPETVPGVSGAGGMSNTGSYANSESGSGSGSGSSDSGSSGTSPASSSQSSSSSGGGFVQGTSSKSGSARAAETGIAGSAVALLGFFIAALMM